MILTGCSCKKDIKVKIDYESIPTVETSSEYLYEKGNLLTYDLESIEEYDEKIANKDNFLLLIYRDGCYGCKLLAPAMQKYVAETGVVVYSLGLEDIPGKHNLFVNDGITSDTPYLVLIEKGKVVYKELVLLKNNAAEDEKWVKKWMDKHVEWSEK
jgi:hypothetical protein